MATKWEQIPDTEIRNDRASAETTCCGETLFLDTGRSACDSCGRVYRVRAVVERMLDYPRREQG